MKSRLAELGGKGLTSPFLQRWKKHTRPKSRFPIWVISLFFFGERYLKQVHFYERNLWGKDSRITPHPVFLSDCKKSCKVKLWSIFVFCPCRRSVFFWSFQIHQPFFETFSCETFRLVKQIEELDYHVVRHFLSRLPLSHFHSNRFSFSQIRHSFFSLEFRGCFFVFSKVRLSQQGIFCSFFFCLVFFSSPKQTPASSVPAVRWWKVG